MGARSRRARTPRAGARATEGQPRLPPEERRWSWREALLALAVSLPTAVVFTWPLAPNLSRTIPAGTGAPTVALFNLFVAEWTGRSLEEGRAYWDAPFFSPYRGTLAWSEPQPFTSALVSLLSKAASLELGYNLVLLGYLAAGGLAGYALARQLTHDRVAASWAALWLTAGAFQIHQLGALHLLAAAFPIGCVALILAQAREPGRAAVCGLAAAYLLTWLTCAQFGLLLTVLLPCLLVPILWRRPWSWPRALALTGPLAVGLLPAAPFLAAQHARLDAMGFERALVDVRGAYRPLDLVLPARGHWLTTGVLGWSERPDAYPWDLGVVPAMCLAAGVATGRLRLRGPDPVLRRRRVALALMAVTGLLLGFGPSLAAGVGGLRLAPYDWLHAVVPGLGGVRTPSRFGLFAIAGLAALAAEALAGVRRRASGARSRRLWTSAAFVLLAAEMWAAPVALVAPGADAPVHDRVVEWLAANGPGQPLVELPMSAGDDEADLEREVHAMRRALRHAHPVVNGYSGHFPEAFRQLRWALLEDQGRARRYLDALGVRLVWAHGHPEASDARALARSLGGSAAFEARGDLVRRLEPRPPAAPTQPPSTATGFSDAPREGDILRIPVEPATGAAQLVTAPPGALLSIGWLDPRGRTHSRRVRLRGSVLVDAGWPRVNVLIRRLSAGARPGDAVLIAEERVARSRRPR